MVGAFAGLGGFGCFWLRSGETSMLGLVLLAMAIKQYWQPQS